METVEVLERTQVGKSATSKLRREGYVPGVIYGCKKPNIYIKIKENTCKTLKKTKLIKLKIKEDLEETVMIKEWQVHPITDKILHIDFCRVILDEAVEFTIPVEITGSPQEGIVEQFTNVVKIKCKPSILLELEKKENKIKVDVSKKSVGQTIYVKDIEGPPGVEFLEPQKVVAKITKLIEVAEAEKEEEVVAPSKEETVEPEVIKKGSKKEEE